MAKYSKEFKEEALKLSDEIGVKKAASQLGLQYFTLADWRKDRKFKEKHRDSKEKIKRLVKRVFNKELSINESIDYHYML